MANTDNINQLGEMWDDILSIISYSVVKYKSKADAAENLSIKKAADAYVNAKLGKDRFDTYLRYDPSVIAFVFNTVDEELIDRYANHPREIPLRYRERCLERQRQLIIENYVERNNYYRMLNGIPDIDDTEYIYVPDEVASHYPYIPQDIPIHELDIAYITFLDVSGELDQIKAMYPDKEYLNYLGSKKIDLITARTAQNFALLRYPPTISNSMKDKLLLIYEQCREYYHSCIYISEYRNTIKYYDNFIALCIMVMTIQQLITRSGKNFIDREFFDSYSVKLLFETYSVPFHAHMDSDTRKLLVQNLNLLIQNKGTNQVVYDIGHILGFDRIQVYTYFLMKGQNFDEDGAPIVAWTTDPETGETVPDYEKMYNIYFERSELQNVDLYNSLHDTTNYHSYMEIVSKDSFWIEDRALMKELYEAEYNYMETKYLGVSIMYKMTRILFENVYLIRLIFDKRMELPGVTIDISKISNVDVTIFDAIVIMCALICKQNHLNGEILFDPSKIMHVIGFNFEDAEAIKQDILDNQYMDDDLAEFLDNLATYDIDGINRVYQHNIIDFYYALLEKMEKTQDIRAYQAYKKLFDTAFYSNENQWAFNIGTEEEPIYPETYIQYLEHYLPQIASFIHSLEESEIYQYVNHICDRLMQIIPDLRYFGFYADSSYSVEMMLVDLIRFFKSYTTELLNMDVIYVFDFKPRLLMRLIARMRYIKELLPKDKMKIGYMDTIWIHANRILKDYLDLHDSVGKASTHLTLKDYLELMDRIMLHLRLDFWEALTVMDETDMHKELMSKDYIEIRDKIFATIEEYLLDGFRLQDMLMIHKDDKFLDPYMLLDEMTMSKLISDRDAKRYKDELHRYAYHHLKTHKYFRDTLWWAGEAEYRILLSFHIMDDANFSKEIATRKDDIQVWDKLRFSFIHHFSDETKVHDTMKYVKDVLGISKVKVLDMSDHHGTLLLKDSSACLSDKIVDIDRTYESA